VQIILLFFGGAEIKDGILSWDGMGRDRHRFMISHHNRSSAGKRSSLGRAEANGAWARARFAYAVSESSRTPPPRSGKSYKSHRDAIGRPAERFMRQEPEPMIAKAGSCRMAGNLGG
jgi:hypothetical protein